MPLRPARKAVAKKPSPKVKGTASPQPSKPSPAAVVEKMADQVAEAPLTSVLEAVPKPSVKEEVAEEEAVSTAAVQEGETPRSAVKVEVGEERADGEAAATENAQDSVDPASEADDEGNKMDSEEGVKEIVHEIGGGVDDHTTGSGVDGAGNVECDDELRDADNSGSDDDEDNEENEEEDPYLYMQAPLTGREKEKQFEIFVGSLVKAVVEADLIKVFGVFGEIQSVRIVKHSSTQKSKGFAFIRYASIDHAKKALAELKDGAEVRGKRARVSASEDNDTLYVGNICKKWTRDNVIETLKGLGIEQMENIFLPGDAKNEGKIKGLAFLEFSSHSDAVAAFQRLKQPNAVFGCDRSAKVAFTASLHPKAEMLLQVKTVYVEGIPTSWEEDNVKEICKQYGEVEKVQLSRNFTKAKRKDFGFVEFTSHESAVACVAGINSELLGEEDTKMKANLAKPQNKGRLAKQGARGGFKVSKDGEVTEEAGQSRKKTNARIFELKNIEGSQPSKSQGKVTEGKSGTQEGQALKGKKSSRRGLDAVVSEQPSKKARTNSNNGKAQCRPFNVFGYQRNAYTGRPKVNYGAHPTTYAPSYAPSITSYQTHAYAGTSGFSRHLEPHAGYISHVRQVHNTYGIDQRRAVAYVNQPISGSGYVRDMQVEGLHVDTLVDVCAGDDDGFDDLMPNDLSPVECSRKRQSMSSTASKGKKATGAAKIDTGLDCLVEFCQESSSVNSSKKDPSDFTIGDCIRAMTEISEIKPGDAIYMCGLRLFHNKAHRETFMQIPEEIRYRYIAEYLGSASQSPRH